MNIFNRKPQNVMSVKELGELFDEEVLHTADLRSKRGRPRNLLIGGRRRVSVALGIQIANLLIDKLTNEGFVIGPCKERMDIYNKWHREEWVGRRIYALAKCDREATSEDPFIQFEKMTGKLIRVQEALGHAGRMQAQYENRNSVLPADIYAWADWISKRGARETKLDKKASIHAIDVARLMVSDQTFEEAKALHLAAIRDGRKPK